MPTPSWGCAAFSPPRGREQSRGPDEDEGKPCTELHPGGPGFCPGSYIYKLVALEESLKLSVLMSSSRSTSAPPASQEHTD